MSTTGGFEQAPEDVPNLVRVTDAERDHVVARLRDAIGQGAIEFEEVEQRLEAVYKAKTHGELDALIHDLPAPKPEPVKRSAFAGFQSVAFRSHLTMYILVNAFLVGIWAMGPRQVFWPYFVIAGWGIALVLNYIAATSYMNHRDERRLKRQQRVYKRQHQHNHHRPKGELSRAARELSEQAMGVAAKQIKEQARKLAQQASQPPHARQHGPPAPRATKNRKRRFVVAMFVDIADSTKLNEAMGDEAWAAERQRFRKQASECFTSEGGWEVSAAGDGILARFDEPGAAVRAAIALQEQLARRRDTQFAPNVRIGIHSGDVIDEGDDIVGSVINLASRVSDASDPDEILITEHVADHLDGSVKTDGRGLHTLKGISQPRHLLAVKW